MVDSPTAPDKRDSNALTVYVLCLLPCAAMWCGLYLLRNTNITLALYHGLCLLPGIVVGAGLWRKDFKIPSKKQFQLLVLGVITFNASTIFLYDHLGYLFLSNDKVMVLLTELGFRNR